VYRGRFAPSPTGPLHFGSLVAALAGYADALRHRGEWLIRIEDVDEARTDPGAAEEIVATLALYGFPTAAEIAVQSRRTDRYQAALRRLQAVNAVFPCSCSRARLADSMQGRLGERLYPGFCRVEPQRPNGPYAWRVRVDAEPIVFTDRLQGRQRQVLTEDVGDFVVRRADGFYAYQLAVVVDDAEQGVTAVVRGADLLASTARQIHLQRLLHYPTPTYLHVPVALDAHGDKLSKQTRAPQLSRDRPVDELLRAWRFLDQPPLPQVPESTEGFWRFAAEHWDTSRLPPVPMLPARLPASPHL
jgi:glutamyl-Q tRNA(Asp) synthetase